jgi:CRP/FNR family cyclic AMP-dependent transcriptional regulator
MRSTQVHHESSDTLTAADLFGIPWFSLLGPGEATRVRHQLIVCSLSAGDTLIRSGSAATHWHGVVHGLLRIGDDAAAGFRTTLGAMRPGAWFGEGFLLKAEPYGFDVTALRDSKVALLPGETFHWLIDHCNAFSRYVMYQLNDRLDHFIAAREIDRIADPDLRVARSLSALFDSDVNPAVDKLLRFTQHELGLLVGLSRQRVNQALKFLEARRLIEIQYCGVQIIDIHALRQMDVPRGNTKLRQRRWHESTKLRSRLMDRIRQ